MAKVLITGTSSGIGFATAIALARAGHIIESGTRTLRHPVGADAEAFLGWRASMSDDDWVAWGALADEDWHDRVSRDFGLDARAKRLSTVAATHSR